MILYVVSDLFQSPARVLVNAVNTVGVMGKGIAAEFRRYYPEMFEQYRALCEHGQFQVGQLWLYKTPHKWILNFPTKRHWRDSSRLEDIEAGLQKFAASYSEKGITSVSFPLLGSGLGGLDWENQVRPLMERYLEPLPIDVFIHLYDGTPEAAPAAWLASVPQTIQFARFWDDITALVQSQPTFQTLDDHTIFTAHFDETERRITLSSANGQAVILSESTLSDLWHYVRAAGYCLPGSLPSGLDTHAEMIVALLIRLDYLRPVTMMRPGALRQTGLHFIPPADSSEAEIIPIEARES